MQEIRAYTPAILDDGWGISIAKWGEVGTTQQAGFSQLNKKPKNSVIP